MVFVMDKMKIILVVILFLVGCQRPVEISVKQQRQLRADAIEKIYWDYSLKKYQVHFEE